MFFPPPLQDCSSEEEPVDASDERVSGPTLYYTIISYHVAYYTVIIS